MVLPRRNACKFVFCTDECAAEVIAHVPGPESVGRVRGGVGRGELP